MDNSLAQKGLSKQVKKRSAGYISPYVLQARNQARHRTILLRKQVNAKKEVVQDWNPDTKGKPFFDPTIQKREIFKILPKKAQQSDVSVDGANVENFHDTKMMLKKTTVKTTGVSI